ncbi:TetR/AcrR family transcriptional regulator [Comamonas serinivorans]|nr:TetR/AcrR family transcriptional regulator [Comamonas serinivorans]
MSTAQSLSPSEAPEIPKRGRGRPRKAGDGASRQALIVAAAKHFRRKGFDATTTRDIAQATGMQSGSPFYHFKSKNALLVAIMEEGMRSAQRSQDAVLAALPGDITARDRLAALVLNHLYVLWLPGNDFVPVMHHEWRSVPPAQRKTIQVLKDAYEVPWRDALAQLEDQGLLGTNASLARSMLFGVLHGSMTWFKPKGALRLEQLARECLNALVSEQPRTPGPAGLPPAAFDPETVVREAWRRGGRRNTDTPSPATSPLVLSKQRAA